MYIYLKENFLRPTLEHKTQKLQQFFYTTVQ